MSVQNLFSPSDEIPIEIAMLLYLRNSDSLVEITLIN